MNSRNARRCSSCAPSLLVAVLVALAVTAILPNAAEARPHLRFGLQSGTLNFADLVDVTWFAPAPEGFPQSPEHRVYRYSVTGLTGFHLGAQLRDDLAILWTRSTATTRLRYWFDGEEVYDGGRTPNGVENALPEYDLQLDVIQARWTPRKFRWHGVGPVIAVGWGWLDQEQTSALNTEGLPEDWSDRDGVWDLALGIEGHRQWSVVGVRGALELRSLHWRFAPDNQNVPEQITRGWVLGARLSLEF